MDTNAGPSLRDANDINTLKEYDVAVERALQELEGEASRVQKGNVQGPAHTTLEEFENAALFLLLGLPFKPEDGMDGKHFEKQ